MAKFVIIVWLIWGLTGVQYIKSVQLHIELYPFSSVVCTGGIMKCLVAVLICVVLAEGVK